MLSFDTGTGTRDRATDYKSLSGLSLCFGFRSLFGTMGLEGFTVPTRSRAMALTSLGALKIFFFFMPWLVYTATRDSATRLAS